MLTALALAVSIGAPATFETFVVTLDSDDPVRLVVNGVRVEEPIGKRVTIEHFVVPGPNSVFIEPMDAKKKAPKVMGQVRLVLGRSDSRSWETAEGQVIATLKRGATVFTAPKELRPPLWRIGHEQNYDADVTYRAKVKELHALLAAKKVDKYLDQFAESYAETERLFPMVKADDLRKHDAEILEAALAKEPLSALPDDKLLVLDLEGFEHLMTCMKKGSRETFRIGDTPVLLRFIKVNGALRPYAAIRP